MVEKISNINEGINKKDLEIILEVNKKAIEVQTEVADQNEEIINLLEGIKKSKDDLNSQVIILNIKMDKVLEKEDDTHRKLFVTQILFIGGLLSIVAQFIQLLLKK